MSDERGDWTSPETPSPSPERARPLGLVVLILVLILLGSLFILSRVRAGRTAAPPTNILSTLVMGDFQLKLSYFYRSIGDQARSDSSMQAAIRAYAESAAEAPTPAGLRRLGVLQGATQPSEALRTFDRMLSEQALRGIGPADRARIRQEVQMWRRVYSPQPITSAQADEFAELILRLNLGPPRYTALERVYSIAGMPEMAERQQTLARNMFRIDVGVVSVLLLLLILGGGAGSLALLILILFPKVSEKLLSMRERHVEDTAISSALWLSFFAYIVIFLGGSFLVAGLLSLFLRGVTPVVGDTYRISGQIAGSFLVNLVALLVVRRILQKEGAGFAEVGLQARGALANVGWGIAGYATAMPLLGFALFIAYLIQRMFPDVPTPANPVLPMIMTAASPGVLLGIFLLVAVVAPFFEEFFFRGVLFRALRSRYGVWAGILASSAIFAMIHPQLPAGFVPIFMLGFIFAILTQARNSLIPAMVAHGINNGGLFIFIHFATRS